MFASADTHSCHSGYDADGAKHFGGKLIGSRKWIGTTEVYTALTYMGVKCVSPHPICSCPPFACSSNSSDAVLSSSTFQNLSLDRAQSQTRRSWRVFRSSRRLSFRSLLDFRAEMGPRLFPLTYDKSLRPDGSYERLRPPYRLARHLGPPDRQTAALPPAQRSQSDYRWRRGRQEREWWGWRRQGQGGK